MKFVNPKNDVAFKKIFGDEHQTSILISFLNATLDLHGEYQIQSHCVPCGENTVSTTERTGEHRGYTVS